MSDLVVAGLDHHGAPEGVLGRGGRRSGEEWLGRFRRRLPAGELAVLATCNRFEVYTWGISPERTAASFAEELALPQGAAAVLPVRAGGAAARHLLSVAAGLESMVVGEDEIQHQVRRALEAGRSQGSLGPVLDALLRAAIACGRRVRSETGLGGAGRSLADVAVRAALAASPVARPALLVLGAGAIASAVVRRLAAEGAAPVVISRSPEHAVRLAGGAGRARSLAELDAAVAEADVVVTGTSASDPLLTRDRVAAAMERRPRRPLVIVDLSVAHDAEPAVGALPGVELFDLDRLGRLDQGSRERFAADVEAATRIVAEEAARFLGWLESRQLAARVAAVREDVRRLALEELQNLLKREGGAVGADRAQAIVSRAIARGFHLALTPSPDNRPLEISR